MANEPSAWTLRIREQLAALKARPLEQQLVDVESLFEATAEHEQELAWQVEELRTEVAEATADFRSAVRVMQAKAEENGRNLNVIDALEAEVAGLRAALDHTIAQWNECAWKLAASAEREAVLVAALDKRHGVEVALDAAESKVFQLQAKLAASAEREAVLAKALERSVGALSAMGVDSTREAEHEALIAYRAAHPPAAAEVNRCTAAGHYFPMDSERCDCGKGGTVELTCRCCGQKVMQPEEDAVDLCAACYRGKGGDTDEPCAAHPPAGVSPNTPLTEGTSTKEREHRE